MKYDNFITQQQAQELMLGIMTRDGEKVLTILIDCLALFALANDVPRLEDNDAPDLYAQIMALPMDRRDALSGAYAILREARR